MSELTLTHAAPGGGTDDRRGQMCRCVACGRTARCSILQDFFGTDGEPLLCEWCVCSDEHRQRHHRPRTEAGTLPVALAAAFEPRQDMAISASRRRAKRRTLR